MRELLAHPGINLNYQSRQGESALFEAVSYKRGDVVEMLVTHPNCQVCLSSCQVLLSLTPAVRWTLWTSMTGLPSSWPASTGGYSTSPDDPQQ